MGYKWEYFSIDSQNSMGYGTCSFSVEFFPKNGLFCLANSRAVTLLTMINIS